VLEAFNGLGIWGSEGGDESAGILYVLPYASMSFQLPSGFCFDCGRAWSPMGRTGFGFRDLFGDAILDCLGLERGERGERTLDRRTDIGERMLSRRNGSTKGEEGRAVMSGFLRRLFHDSRNVGDSGDSSSSSSSSSSSGPESDDQCDWST